MRKIKMVLGLLVLLTPTLVLGQGAPPSSSFPLPPRGEVDPTQEEQTSGPSG